MTSLLYPHTVAITRPTHPNGVGAVGYGGALRSTETEVISGVDAAIQQKKEGRLSASHLPGSARMTLWRIFVRVADGVIHDRDVITDEHGIRYQVQSAYWTVLGYNCLCERLEN